MKDKIKQVLAQRELARRNLEFFVKYKMKYFYNRAYRDNWSNGYLCEYLTACYLGQIRTLIIQEPPSSGKTEFSFRSFVPWVWLNEPNFKWIYVTYGDKLTKDHSQDIQTFVTSKEYNALTKHKDLKWISKETKFLKNNYDGMLFATTISGAITGAHANGIIIDDPMKASEAYSEASRNAVLSWYQSSTQSRYDKNNPKHKGFTIVIMQRLHPNDLAGHIIESDPNAVSICLKMIEESKVTYYYPNSNEIYYEREPNELLFKNHDTKQSVEELKLKMGHDDFMTQYQQDPRVSIAGFFEVDRLKQLQNYELPTHNEYIIIDPAESTSKTADNRAITCMGVWSENGEISYAIKDCLFGKWELDESIQNIINMMYEYPNAKVFIEPAGGGITLKRELEKAVVKQNAKLLSSGKNPLKNTIDSLKVDKQKNAKNERIMALKLYINTGNLAMRYDAKGKEQIIKELNAFNPERKANEDNCIDTIALCVANTHTLKPYEIKQNATNTKYKRRTTWNI